MSQHHSPFVSVVMPAHNASAFLPRTLGALLESDLPRHQWELIVVDDASTDASAAIATRYAHTVVRITDRAHGPAYARNRGVEVARGDIVVFVDSDVVVHKNTLRLLAHALSEASDVGAVFGSYDEAPTAPGVVSQYRNLLHHYVHQQNPGERDTFWAGAGAVRKSTFIDAGMYDEWHYPRPQIEDIELGGRIIEHGQRILLRPDIQVTHLKKWTLLGIVRTDLRDRGIPWARLLLHRKAFAKTKALNLRWTEKLNTVLVWSGLGLLPFALFTRSWTWVLVSLGCFLATVLISFRLFGFFARSRGIFFAIQVLPLQLLYYFLNGISFGVGWLLKEIVGAPLPDPRVEAYAELGVERWPPVPSRARPSTWTSDRGDKAP